MDILATWNVACLSNPVDFYDGVTTSVDKGRAADVTYLDFYKATAMVSYNIFLSKLDTDGFDGCSE